MVIEFSIHKSQRINEFPAKCNVPIILFGAGAGGITYSNFIKNSISTPILFCDNNPEKWGTMIHGIPVISFDELKSDYRDSQIVITSAKYYDSLLQQLIEHDMHDNLSKIAFDILYNKNYNDYFEVVKKNLERFSSVYNMLSDEISKKTFYAKINYCILANSSDLLAVRSKAEQYFEADIFTLSENEIFIDGGAYTGDTVETFLLLTNSKYKKIYSFEPDQTQHILFNSKFGDDETIQLMPYGLWSKKDTLFFEMNKENPGGNKINNDDSNNKLQVPVISIDEVLNGQPATLIKMDIEGSELEALQGAKLTIKKYRPKLAICVYHKPMDIVEIPLYIKELVPEYKLYLRHYSTDHNETVLYAIAE